MTDFPIEIPVRGATLLMWPDKHTYRLPDGTFKHPSQFEHIPGTNVIAIDEDGGLHPIGLEREGWDTPADAA